MSHLTDRLTRYDAAALGDLLCRHGRMPSRPLPYLYWTGSGVSLVCRASELWLELETAYQKQEETVRVTVNGFTVHRSVLSPGVTRICVYRGLSFEESHTVRLYKETQPSSEAEHFLRVNAVYTDGALLPPPTPRYRFEFLGDSLTSGEGLCGAREEKVWCPYVFSSDGLYPYLVGEALCADVSVVALSGNGIAAGCTGNPKQTIPPIYPYVAGRSGGEGAKELYDIKSRDLDLVVINLGTNDFGATRRPIFVDPETKEEFVMQKGEDGRLLPECHQTLMETALAFGRTVRESCPRARMLYVYNMNSEQPELGEILCETLAALADENAALLKLPTCTPAQRGARNHPGAASHKAVANAILAYLAENPLA